MAAEILDLVGVAVGGAALHSVGQVEDDLIFRRSAQLFQHPVADEDGVVHFRAGKALGGILIPDIDAAAGHFFLGELPDEPGPFHRDVNDALHIRVEYHLALESGSGIIEMDNDILGALNRLKGLLNQMGPGLHQHLDGHIIGNQVPFDEGAENFVLRFGSGGEAHFNLFKPDIHQHLEKLQLLFQIHGVNKGLVTVPQVHAAPNRRLGNHFVRPCAVLQLYRLKRNVLFETLIHKNHLPVKICCWEFAEKGPGQTKRPGYGKRHIRGETVRFRGTTLVQLPLTRTALYSLQQGYGL